MFEIDNGGDHGVVDNHVAENLTGSRATKYSGPFEVVAQFAHEVTCLHQRSSAKNERDTLLSDFASWQIRQPPVILGPFILSRFHGWFPLVIRPELVGRLLSRCREQRLDLA